MRNAALLLAVALLACSSDDAPATCAALRGTYKIHYEARFAGGCGPIPDVTVVYGGDGSVSEGQSPDVTCNTPTTSTSPDGCEASFAVKCAAKDGSWQSNEVTTAKGTSDGRSASGVYELTITGKGACQTTYDLTYTKQ